MVGVDFNPDAFKVVESRKSPSPYGEMVGVDPDAAGAGSATALHRSPSPYGEMIGVDSHRVSP